MHAGPARGFSLIEALVTMTVLALLLAVAVPSMATFIRNTNVRTMSESIQNGLQKARNEALRRNRQVTFWMVTPANVASLDSSCALSSASGSWVVSMDDPSGSCDVAPSLTTTPRILEAHGAGAGNAGVSVAAKGTDGTTSATQVTFNGFGQPVQTGTPIGVIDITHSDPDVRRLRVTVSTGGSVRACDRGVTSPDPRAC